jgi:hypothetical protein
MSDLVYHSSPAAERMRLHRERRRQGFRCLMIELHVTEIEALVAKGLLNSERRNDPGALYEALYAHLEQTLRATRDVKQGHA